MVGPFGSWLARPGRSPGRPLRIAALALVSVLALGGAWLAPAPALAQAVATDGSSGSGPAASRRKAVPVHLSLGSGVFRPWDGDRGWNLSGSAHVGLGSNRFWLGGELEYRRYEVEMKRDYRPDTNSFAVRFSFQYHPFPKALLSPYVGISVGVMLHRVDDDDSRQTGEKVREDWSGGFTMLGLAGVQVPLGTERLHFFAEGRLGNSSDVWKRKGANFQVDQVDGITGMGGLRVSF